MKAGALALALAISAVQTVGWVECCCILICKHRNDPCSDCKEKKEPAQHASCCDKKEAPAPAPEKRCSHVEPSSEVLVQAPAAPPVIFDLVLDLPVVPELQAPLKGSETDRPFAEIRGSPPLLHLLHSVLLI
jgi:hypothetical protein